MSENKTLMRLLRVAGTEARLPTPPPRSPLQIHHRCGQLKALGLLPRMLEDLSNVVSQSYQGDVTIVPRLERQDYAKCVRADPRR